MRFFRIIYIALLLLATGFFVSSAQAAVSFVGSATGNSSVDYPLGTRVGDLVVAYAFRANSESTGTLPGGWIPIHDSGSNGNWARLAFRYVVAGDTSTGTFGSSNGVIIHVYRGVRNDYSISNLPRFSIPGTGTSATVTYPAITLAETGGTSYVVRFGSMSQVNSSMHAVISGLTKRGYKTYSSGGNTSTLVSYDTNGGTSFSGAVSANVVDIGRWRAYTIEIGSANLTPAPAVTSVGSIGTNAVRTYSTSDTDGIVQIIGSNFGTTAGSVTFSWSGGSVIGVLQTTAAGSCTVGGWTENSVCVRVPDSIPANVYNITATITTTNDDSVTTPTLSILPRVSGITPASAAIGDVVTISGDHLCPGGICPTSLDTLSFVTFTSNVRATSLISWSGTEIKVQVPYGASTGGVQVGVLGVTSNVSTSIAIISTMPDAPNLGPSSTLGQFDMSNATISTGGGTSNTQVNISAAMSAGLPANLILEVELKTIDAAFTGTGTVSGSAVSYLSSPVIGTVSITLLDGESYHWRARVKNIDTGEISSWIAFGSNPLGDGSGDGVPANADLFISTSAPSITGVGTAPACTAVSQISDTNALVKWAASSYQNTSGIKNSVLFGTSSTLQGAMSVLANNGASPQVSLNNLTAETVYYYQVRSEDTLGTASLSPSSTPYCQFVTEAATVRSNKLSEYYICQASGVNESWAGGSGVSCASGNVGAKKFQVFVSEQTLTKPVVQVSSYIEVYGISDATQDFTVTVNVNGGTPITHTIKNPNGVTPWRILYYVDGGFNLDYPADVSAENLLDVDIQGVNLTSTLGAKAILTYYYYP